MEINQILNELEKMFPDAKCELIHESAFQLAVAVVLSAQATDVSVNKVTPQLFKKYPTSLAMAKASIRDLEKEIKTIGLYRNKAKHIHGLAAMLEGEFNGVMPQTLEELIVLPGVGRKSANVILSVCFGIPAIAVDTHVERIAKRLGLAYKKDSVLQVEKKLMKKVPQERWTKAHHLFIFFGRYFCTAKNPQCESCVFRLQCKDALAKRKMTNH
ncbi:MAG: endonuclease III [Anaerorhabdus sp.]